MYECKVTEVSVEYSRSSRNLRILLVDDDDFMCELISHTLHELGQRDIITAADGERALVAFDSAHTKPDLILCDIQMPGQDGFQFMNGLATRAFKGGIVLISGLENRILQSAKLMAQFHELNILGALQKPVDKSSLGEVIAKMR